MGESDIVYFNGPGVNSGRILTNNTSFSGEFNALRGPFGLAQISGVFGPLFAVFEYFFANFGAPCRPRGDPGQKSKYAARQASTRASNWRIALGGQTHGAACRGRRSLHFGPFGRKPPGPRGHGGARVGVWTRGRRSYPRGHFPLAHTERTAA